MRQGIHETKNKAGMHADETRDRAKMRSLHWWCLNTMQAQYDCISNNHYLFYTQGVIWQKAFLQLSRCKLTKGVTQARPRGWDASRSLQRLISSFIQVRLWQITDETWKEVEIFQDLRNQYIDWQKNRDQRNGTIGEYEPHKQFFIDIGRFYILDITFHARLKKLCQSGRKMDKVWMKKLRLGWQQILARADKILGLNFAVKLGACDYWAEEAATKSKPQVPAHKIHLVMT